MMGLNDVKSVLALLTKYVSITKQFKHNTFKTGGKKLTYNVQLSVWGFQAVSVDFRDKDTFHVSN